MGNDVLGRVCSECFGAERQYGRQFTHNRDGSSGRLKQYINAAFVARLAGFACASLIGLAALLPTEASAQSSLEQKVAKAYGFDNDQHLNEKLRDVATVMAHLNCGSAMTANACHATNRFFIIELQRNPAKVRADLMVFLNNRYAGRGGFKAALQEARKSPDPSTGCSGAATLACKTLIDFFFAGGVIEPLKEARQKAAKTVPVFYKDGRAFDG